MAQMHPSQLDSKAPPAKRAVYERLAQTLADEFSVIYDISFSDPQDSANRQRRIDFLIIHPDLGLLTLEATGGAVRLADNQWHSRDATGKDNIIVNPYLQAQNDRAAFSRWLRYDGNANQYAMVYNRHIGYAVALPDTDAARANLGLTASPRNTIDQGDLAGLETAVRRVMEHAETNYQIPPQAISVLIATLAQAQAAPRPTVVNATPAAPPALQKAGSAALGTRVIALLVVLAAVALLAIFLLFSHNQTSPPAIIARAGATSTPATVVLDTPTPTAAAPIASDTPFITAPIIATSTLTNTPQLAVGVDAQVTQDGNLRVRTQPTANADIIVKLAPGVKLRIVGGPQQAEGYTWWQVGDWPNASGSTGWCAGDFLQPVANQSALAPTVTLPSPVPSPTALPVLSNPPAPQLAIGSDALVTQDGNLRVHSQPAAAADVVVELSAGRRIHIIGGPQQADGHTWWQVGGWPDSNGATGWCAGEFLQPVSP